MLILAISQLSGCAWFAAVSQGSYDCYEGLEVEYQLAQFLGPLVLIDLPFTFVADATSLTFCWY